MTDKRYVGSLNWLRDEALRIAVEHGFTEGPDSEALALMHSEISEGLEDLRKGLNPTFTFYTKKVPFEFEGITYKVEVEMVSSHAPDGTPYKPCGVPSELADLIIRVLHFAGKHGIDIEDAIAEKMAYNDRAREFKHGKKF